MDDWRIEVSECIEVIDRGAKPFGNFSRKIFVKG
jgi:hypothetical protein